MKYNFDKEIDRYNTNSIKYDACEYFFKKKDLLPAWVADTDFESPIEISNAIKKRLEHNIFGYTYKNDSYYNSIINWYNLNYNYKIKKEWINFSPGVVTGIINCIHAYTNPGDKIIVQTPVYTPFITSIEDCNRIVIKNELINENGFYKMDIKDFIYKIDAKVKMLVLCSPHNPVGRVWTESELKEISEICLKNNILVVSDEIHSDIIFNGSVHTPFMKVSEKISQNSIIISSPSKIFNIAGFFTSYVLIKNLNLRKKYEKTIKMLSHFNGTIFGDIAIEAAYTFGFNYKKELICYLAENLNFIEQFLLKNLPLIEFKKPEGTFLIWLDFKNYNLSEKELFDIIECKAKLALSRGSIYHSIHKSTFVRLNFGTNKAKLEKILNRLYLSLKDK